jgi:hypothetical protein
LKLRRPDLNPEDLVGVGLDGLQQKINDFLNVGFSKFVIRPAAPPMDWSRAVETVSDVVKLQT